MISVFICVTLLASSIAQARVTFYYSEVLQPSDLTEANQNRAAFKCGNGCKVYTDLHANNMYITELNEQTGLYAIVTNFNAIGASPSNDVQPLPDPYVLQASNNYYVENRGEKDPQFVFYAVDMTSPNQFPVMIVTDDFGLWLNGSERMESAENTAVSVFSSISTVDYGNESGKNNVIVNWNQNGQISQDAEGSSVYMSPGSLLFSILVSKTDLIMPQNHQKGGFPGYIGCTYLAEQSYTSTRNSVQDSFKIDAASLDANAKLHLTTQEDALQLTINADNFGLFGAPTFTKHYEDDSYNVAVKWNRKLSNANFALQLDFGLGKTASTTTAPISTTSVSTLTSTPIPTTLTTSIPTTTTSSSVLCRTFAPLIALMFTNIL